jgi:CspA family cold shock protein
MSAQLALSVNSRGARHGDGHSEMVQCDKRLRVYSARRPDAGGPDVFVHISAVERAGMRDLNDGQKIAYEVVADKRSGKSSADNLKPA